MYRNDNFILNVVGIIAAVLTGLCFYSNAGLLIGNQTTSQTESTTQEVKQNQETESTTILINELTSEEMSELKSEKHLESETDIYQKGKDDEENNSEISVSEETESNADVSSFETTITEDIGILAIREDGFDKAVHVFEDKDEAIEKFCLLETKNKLGTSVDVPITILVREWKLDSFDEFYSSPIFLIDTRDIGKKTAEIKTSLLPRGEKPYSDGNISLTATVQSGYTSLITVNANGKEYYACLYLKPTN